MITRDTVMQKLATFGVSVPLYYGGPTDIQKALAEKQMLAHPELYAGTYPEYPGYALPVAIGAASGGGIGALVAADDLGGFKDLLKHKKLPIGGALMGAGIGAVVNYWRRKRAEDRYLAKAVADSLGG